MSRRHWLGFGFLIALIAILVTLRGTAGSDSPEHSSASDGTNGTSALRAYAQALGYSAGTIEGDFSLPSARSLLFVFTPSAGNSYSISEAQQLRTWVAAGNVVVYAAEDGDALLDQQFGLRRSTKAVNATARAAAPVFGGVASLSGASDALAFRTTPSQVPLVRNSSGDVLALRATIGSGILLAMSDPRVLTNGYLKLADNWRLAADLIAMTPPGGSVLFDEFHHGEVAAPAPAVAWVSTPWGAALTLAVLVILLGLALRGRAFGPAIPLRTETDRSSAEYAAAVGSLLHRTGARAVTLETLLAATRRSVAERVGLSRDTPPEQLDQALAQRAPGVARELAGVQAAASQPLASENEVLALARRMHQLAYPPAPPRGAKGDRA